MDAAAPLVTGTTIRSLTPSVLIGGGLVVFLKAGNELGSSGAGWLNQVAGLSKITVAESVGRSDFCIDSALKSL